MTTNTMSNMKQRDQCVSAAVGWTPASRASSFISSAHRHSNNNQ